MDASLKRLLKARGQTLDPSAWIGKEGIHPALVREVQRTLDEADLIKVRLGGGDAAARKTLVQDLAGSVGGEVVAVTGRTALLYRAFGSAAG